MFWKESRVKELERKVQELSDRLYKAESAFAPMPVGELPSWWWQCSYLQKDPRPSVTHAQDIQMLLDHGGIEFKKIDGTPERVVLEKKPKPTVTAR